MPKKKKVKPITLHLEPELLARLKQAVKQNKPLSQQGLIRQMIDHCLEQIEMGKSIDTEQHEIPPPPNLTETDNEPNQTN